MGFLRLWLAVGVLASHTTLVSGTVGVLAVECFFAISGFYIQMILLENYSHQRNWITKFWLSRLARLYIPYWIIMVIIIFTSPIFYLEEAKNFFHKYTVIDTIVSVFINIFILGTEHIKLLRVTNDGNLYLWDDIVIKQAWSVGMEIIFYLFAPLILLSKRITVVTTIICLTGKFFFLYKAIPEIFNILPWDWIFNTIFPFEVGIFTLGALMYHLYAYIEKSYVKKNSSSMLNSAIMYSLGILFVVVLSVALCIVLNRADSNIMIYYKQLVVSYYAYLAIIIIMIPVMFHLSKFISFDRFIGELSYSYYLWHLFIIQLVKIWNFPILTTFAISAIITVLCSVPVVLFIERPIMNLRHRLFRNKI